MLWLFYLFILLPWLFWRWDLGNFLPQLASNRDLPISASQVSRITSVKHQCPALHLIFFNHFKNGKTILGLQTIPKQRASRICPVCCCSHTLPTSQVKVIHPSHQIFTNTRNRYNIPGLYPSKSVKVMKTKKT
jgi:hypothetical protein